MLNTWQFKGEWVSVTHEMWIAEMIQDHIHVLDFDQEKFDSWLASDSFANAWTKVLGDLEADYLAA